MGIASLDVVDDAGVTSLMGNVSVGYGPNAPFASAGLTFGVGVALAVEAIAAGLLTLVVLAVVAKKISRSAAPFAIALTYGVLMMWAIPLTNGGLNPARATATALFSDTWALQQLWAWWLAPLLGAAVVGLLYRIYRPTEDTENAVESVED
jgi:aquaporin Z